MLAQKANCGKYLYTRKSLRKANTQKRASSADDEPISSPEISTDDELTKLDFLKVAIEPFSKILEFWEETYTLRKRLYINSSLEDIFKDFPCLSLNSGIELVSLLNFFWGISNVTLLLIIFCLGYNFKIN